MDSKRVTSEPTTTIHLGLRSVTEIAQNPIESYLSQLSDDDRSVIDAVINGSRDKAMVVIHRGPSRGARFLITSEGAAIGRATTADIFLDDITVSRNHARIEYRDNSFFYKDSGSLNGSYINNQSVTDQQLNSGDEIQIGKFHVLFIAAHGTK